MPVSSAHLCRQLDSQDAAKQLQTERGAATSPPHFSQTSVLWKREHSAHIVLSQNSILSLVEKKKVSSQSSYKPQIHLTSKCRDQVYNFPGGSHESEERAHMVMPYSYTLFFILTVDEICHFLSLSRYYQTHQKLLLPLGMNPIWRCSQTCIKIWL